MAVADASEGAFATLDGHGSVSVWAGPDRLMSRFSVPDAAADVAVPSDRLAIVSGGTDMQVVVGFWSRGVAAFTEDGAPLWHRRDIRQVQAVRALPTGASGVLAVVSEHSGGHILGAAGGTRHRVQGARFLAGWPDGSILVHRNKVLARVVPGEEQPLWRTEAASFGVVDAALDEGCLVCWAGGRLTYLDAAGALQWQASGDPGHTITRICPDPGSDGWLCLAPSHAGGRPHQILHIARDGAVSVRAEISGPVFRFAGHGRYTVTVDGKIHAG